MSTATNDRITVSIQLDFVKQLFHGLTLEQMQDLSAYLNEAIQAKILSDIEESTVERSVPLFTPDMLISWEEESNEEEEIELTEEEFTKAVQELS